MLTITENDESKVITAKDLLKKFSDFDFQKLKKSKVFVLNKELKGYDRGATAQAGGQKKTRTPLGRSFPAVFTAKNINDPDGLDVEIRYSKGRPHKRNVRGTVIDVFEPRLLRLEGDSDMLEDDELAVFYFLNPRNRQSPFRESGKVYVWEYEDKSEIAKASMDEIDELYEALNHAKTVHPNEAVLFAKAFGVTSTGLMDMVEVRAKLSQFAKGNPKDYLVRIRNSETLFNGTINDAIDMGVFYIADTYGQRAWHWGKGSKKGEYIVDISAKETNERKPLLQHINANIENYYFEVEKAYKSAKATVTARDFIDKQLKGEPVIEQTQDAHTKLPDTFTEAEEYLRMLHPEQKNASKQKASEFLKAIKAGEITFENIGEALNYIAKSE